MGLSKARYLLQRQVRRFLCFYPFISVVSSGCVDRMTKLFNADSGMKQFVSTTITVGDMLFLLQEKKLHDMNYSLIKALKQLLCCVT